MVAIQANSIVKHYGKVEALRGVDLSVPKGELFGIIGPDGAGKTTLFHILTTLILADEGTASVEGFDVVKGYKEIRKRVGYMPGRFSLYEDLSVEENIRFFAALFNTTLEQNYELVKEIYVQIEPFKKRRAGALSGGMKQKLALTCALIHRPDVLFLDEPTTGVDPVSRKEFWQMLRRLKDMGITMLVSTPYMDEATLCDRISLIKDGQFLQTDTPQGIIAGYNEILWAVSASEMPCLLRDLRENRQVKTAFAFGDVHHITVNPDLTQEQLRRYLDEKGHTNIEIGAINPNIEDCYMQLAGASRHTE